MTEKEKELNINQFNKDIEDYNGYVYTSNKLSSKLANQRLSQAISDLIDLKGKSVIDVGCGDGTSTVELLKYKPEFVLGIDAAEKAIALANERFSKLDNISFKEINIYELEQHIDKSFDVVIVRGVLHHLYDIEMAIYNITKIAKEIIVTEHNGYNPLRRIVEKVSRYQIEHEEKSYLPGQLNNWFKKNGGIVADYSYCGTVPFFCPDIMAKFFKKLEPIIEKIPVLKQLSCGAYVFKIYIKG